MASKGAASKPASTANARVTVNSAAGSKFMLRSSVGDLVVDFGAVVKLVSWLIVPSGIPNDVTLDVTFVICRGALNGLSRVTVTWLTLFSFPVVDNTIQTCLRR